MHKFLNFVNVVLKATMGSSRVDMKENRMRGLGGAGS